MGAKKKPLDSVGIGDVGIDAVESRRRGLRRAVRRSSRPPGEGRGRDHRGRGHGRDGRKDRRLARRAEADLRRFGRHGKHPGLRAALRRRDQQELPGCRLRGRQAGAAELGGEAHAILLGENVPRRSRPRRSANTARRRRSSPRAPRVSPSRSSTRWRRRSPTAATPTRCSAAACSGSRSARAWPHGSRGGVMMEVTSVRAENGELIAERPILGDSSISEVKYRSGGRDHHRPPQRVRDQQDVGGADAEVDDARRSS